MLSHYKNKKICIVKSEHWDLVFDKTTCIGTFQKVFKALNCSMNSSAIRTLVEDRAFSAILSRLLYSSSKIIALTLILKDPSENGLNIRKMKLIDNFITMMIYPEYIGMYNDRAGKFALECLQ